MVFIGVTKERAHRSKLQLALFDYTLALLSCNKSMKQPCSCPGKLSLCNMASVCCLALLPSVTEVLG